MNNSSKIVLLAVLGMLCIPFVMQAQNIWDLKTCIDYAKEHSIQVKKSEISLEESDISLKQSKASLFPTLNGSVSQSFSNGRVKNLDGTYGDFDGTFSGQYNLSSGVTLFNGGTKLNTIKQMNLTKDLQGYNLEMVKNNIELSITEAYFQILYAEEMAKSNEGTLEASEAQMKRSKALLDAGSISRSDYAQVEAQYNSDKYNLINAQNTLTQYKLQLKQLLELDNFSDIEVFIPEIGEDEILAVLPAKADIYSKALEIMPEMKSAELSKQIAEYNVSISKAGYMPSLSLNTSIGTSNLYNQTLSVASQWKYNFTQSAGLSLSIPIFNGRQVKSSVQKSKLGLQTANLEYTNQEKELFRTIETLYQDVIAGQQKYQAAKEKLKSAELSYELTMEQFNLGIRNAVEYLTEKNNYNIALQEVMQAKYTSLLSIKSLNFYRGVPIKL